MAEMLIGENSAAPAEGDIIKDVTEADFMKEVVEKSMQVPVIVGFLGAVVRAVQDSGSRARSRGCQSQGPRGHGQGQCR